MTDGSVFTSSDLRGKPGLSLTVLAFAASDVAGYNAAVAAHATDPLTLVIRYAD